MAITSLMLFVGCSDSRESRSYSSDWVGVEETASTARVTVKLGNATPNVSNPVPIIVSVYNSVGAPLPETEVNLTSNNGGSFEESSVETDDRGFAKAVFTPEIAGTTVITAAAEGHFGVANLHAFPKEKTEASISIFTSTDKLPVEGSLIVQIFSADSNGTIYDDTPINVICTVGSLGDNNGTLENGWFSTEYTAPNAVGVATITAMVQGITVSKTISIQ